VLALDHKLGGQLSRGLFVLSVPLCGYSKTRSCEEIHGEWMTAILPKKEWR
jgi:hypothetical protein